MNIDWIEVFPWKCEGRPPGESLARPIPFQLDFETNVYESLEWLIRERRPYELYASEEALVTHVRDGWYTQNWAPGMLYHVCDGRSLLRFRADYENAYRLLRDMNLRDSPTTGMMVAVNARKKCIEARMSMWGVVGRDGYMQNWFNDYDDDYNLIMAENIGIDKFADDGVGYRWRCHKCQSEMPKGVKAWIKMHYVNKKLRG